MFNSEQKIIIKTLSKEGYSLEQIAEHMEMPIKDFIENFEQDDSVKESYDTGSEQRRTLYKDKVVKYIESTVLLLLKKQFYVDEVKEPNMVDLPVMLPAMPAAYYDSKTKRYVITWFVGGPLVSRKGELIFKKQQQGYKTTYKKREVSLAEKFNIMKFLLQAFHPDYMDQDLRQEQLKNILVQVEAKGITPEMKDLIDSVEIEEPEPDNGTVFDND